jgi:hypothetical protein
MSELAAYYAGDRAALVSALLRHGFAGQSDAAADELIRAGWRRVPREPTDAKVAMAARAMANETGAPFTRLNKLRDDGREFEVCVNRDGCDDIAVVEAFARSDDAERLADNLLWESRARLAIAAMTDAALAEESPAKAENRPAGRV